MLVKTVKCKDITFETVEDILKYKLNEVDHAWHLTKECVEILQKTLNGMKLVQARLNEIDEDAAANSIISNLEQMDEDTKTVQDALRMNSLLQSEPLKTDPYDDIEDEAEEILNENHKEDLPDTVVSGDDGYSF